MNEITSSFKRLDEYIPYTLSWDEIDDIYESPDSSEILEKVIAIPVIKHALENESQIHSMMLDICQDINRIKDSNAFDVESVAVPDISWETLITIINKSRFLALIHGLAGLALLDPLAVEYRKLSITACSTYLLSLTLAGANGYEIFQEKIVQQALSVFDLILEIQKKTTYKNQSHINHLWVNFTNYVDHLKQAFNSCSLSSSPELKDLILQKIFDFQDYNFLNGYSSNYSLIVQRKLFHVLEIFLNVRHGPLNATAMDIIKWTWDFHRYPLHPKRIGFSVPQSKDDMEHISQWFCRGIENHGTIIVDGLHFYIKCVVECPDKDWRPEHTKQALEYAAKYDAEIYKKTNKSLIPYMENLIKNNTDINACSRAIELLGYIAQHESYVEWVLGREEVSTIPREIEILRILIDSLKYSNATLHTKALQSLQSILSSPNTNAGKMFVELIKNCKFSDTEVELPFDCPKTVEEGSEEVTSYSFTGYDYLSEHIQDLPQRVYEILYSKTAHTKRVALCFIELIVNLNKRIVYKTDFCKELSRLKDDPSVIVTRQAMQTIDSILTKFPRCFPVVWTWCELFTSILNNTEEKSDSLAREYFKKKVLDNFRSFHESNAPEHLLPWEIIQNMFNNTSRIYFQNNMNRLLVPGMISRQLIDTIVSHLDHKNMYLALVVLNLICPYCKADNLDFIVDSAFTVNLFNKEYVSDDLESSNSQNRITDERVVLAALELFTSCIKKFSKAERNKLFKEVIRLLKAGRLFNSTISRALNLLQQISKSFKGDEHYSWEDDVHQTLEEKLVPWISELPQNYAVFIPCFMTYVLLNNERLSDIPVELQNLVRKYLYRCSMINESQISKTEEFVYNSFIIIAGILSFRNTDNAIKYCSQFIQILKNCEIPSIVKNLTVIYTDICRKHGRDFVEVLCEITAKFESKDVKNRVAAYEGIERLIREEQLKLKGNLLYRMVFVMLDSDIELSNQFCVFLIDFACKKNPKFIQKCLEDFPVDLNGYNHGQIVAYEYLKTGLYGEENRSLREKIYEQFISLEKETFLMLYFTKLSVINGNFSDVEKMTMPETIGMVKDVCFILKIICKQEFSDSSGLEIETRPEGEKPEPQSKPTQKGRGKNREPILTDVMEDLPTHLDSILKIRQFYSNYGDESVIKSIDDLALAVFQRFPEFIKLALNSENYQIKTYWLTIKKTYEEKQEPIAKEKTPRKRKGSTYSSVSDESMDESHTKESHKKSRSKNKSSESENDEGTNLEDTGRKTIADSSYMGTDEGDTSKQESTSKTHSNKRSQKPSQKKNLRKKKVSRILFESSDSDEPVDNSKRNKSSRNANKIDCDGSSDDEQPLSTNFNKIKLTK